MDQSLERIWKESISKMANALYDGVICIVSCQQEVKWLQHLFEVELKESSYSDKVFYEKGCYI
jgi:hypothetical protein